LQWRKLSMWLCQNNHANQYKPKFTHSITWYYLHQLSALFCGYFRCQFCNSRYCSDICLSHVKTRKPSYHWPPCISRQLVPDPNTGIVINCSWRHRHTQLTTVSSRILSVWSQIQWRRYCDQSVDYSVHHHSSGLIPMYLRIKTLLMLWTITMHKMVTTITTMFDIIAYDLDKMLLLPYC